MKRMTMLGCLVAALALSGCSTVGGHAAAGAGASRPHRRTTPSASAPPTARLRGSTHRHPAGRPLVFTAAHGTISSLTVRGGGHTVPVESSQQGRRWRSTGQLIPGTRYRARLDLVGADGRHRTRTLSVRTRKAARTLTMTATPGPGWTDGVGEPVVVHFSSPVSDEAAVERHLSISTSHGPVRGSWHWFSPTVVHYRPRHFWPADTTVHVHVDLRGVRAGHGLWGDRDHDWSWRVGNRHVTRVNARRHTFTVTDNGKTVHRWPTGMGMPGFATRDGIYAVIDKEHTVQMTSCSVGLSCNRNSANYYNLKVYWATRLTDTGTFVHAAPWDSQLGRANTSHGCIHLSTADAQSFYQFSSPGDVVVVRGTGRAPDLPSDPGMMDWNMSWSQWKAGSALHH